MEMPGFMSDENALKAEIASLKLQKESLEIRLAAANDEIVSLQHEVGEVCESWRHCQNVAEMYRHELLRRGADDPRKSKPPCDTAFAALQVVCKHWDREECFADLRKQRSENLRRIAALESGRELKMGTVMRALEEDTEHPTGTLLYALRNMREQLSWIFESDAELNDKPHDQWFEPPLSLFRLHADQNVDSSDEAMDETDEDDDSESME